MSIATTGECLSVTVGMNKGGVPFIKRVSTEGLVASDSPALVEEGMEVTSISYNGHSAYLSSGKRPGRQNKLRKMNPFRDNKTKVEPGTSVTAVAMKMVEYPDGGGYKELFLVQGVTFGSKSYKDDLEVLVYSTERLSNDHDNGDDIDNSSSLEYESISNSSFSDETSSEGSIYSIETDLSSVSIDKEGMENLSWLPPPIGVPYGGYWCTQRYIGSHTVAASIVGCFCLGFLGPTILCCPFDERRVYIVDGLVYAECGKCIATED